MLSIALALTVAALAPEPELVYDAPITYHNITLVPVLTRAPGPFQSYTLLEEGTARKTLKIRELAGSGDQASVNEVEVRNTGKEPVFLLSGEMILGGKQDRILQSDAIIPPTGKWTRVPVFCVEHGRWSGARMEFAAGGALAHGKLAQAALSGEQGAVWAEVARKNEAEGTESSTGTYRRTVQDEALRARIQKHRDALKSQLPRGRLAGFVFAVNGDVRVADLFGNPVLLDALQDKLLSAYVLEALEESVDPSARPLPSAAAQQFVSDGKKAATKQKISVGTAENQVKESADIIANESVDTASGLGTRGTYINKKRKK